MQRVGQRLEQRVGHQIDGRQRAITLAIVALLHLLAILAVLASRTPLMPIEPDPPVLALFEPIAPDPPPVEPPPVEPPPVEPPPVEPPPVEPLLAETAKREAPAGPPVDRAAPSGPPLRSAPADAPPAPDHAIPAPSPPAQIPPIVRLPSPMMLPLAPSTIAGTAGAITDDIGGGDSNGSAAGDDGAGGGGSGAGGGGDGRTVRYARARWVRKPTRYDWSRAWPRHNGKWVEGEAVLGCELQSTGRPKRCWVIAERPGDIGLGLAAVKLSRSFVVRHVLRDGEATDMSVRVPVSFHLRKQ